MESSALPLESLNQLGLCSRADREARAGEEVRADEWACAVTPRQRLHAALNMLDSASSLQYGEVSKVCGTPSFVSDRSS